MELQCNGFCVEGATSLKSTNFSTDSGICSEGTYNTTTQIFSSEYKETERRNTFMELYQTEVNYIKLLNIVQQMKDFCLNFGEEMIKSSDVNLIFGQFNSIKKLHDSFLWNLNAFCIHWKEDCEIGKAVQQFCRGILHAYTPFITNFETMEETLSSCTNSRPRFYAYLQLMQIESNKQHLKDITIRPVQRLPSMLILIKVLINKTDKSNADYEDLILAKTQLENSIADLNSGKERLANSIKQFQIFKAISNSPNTVLSSKRQYILNFGAVQIEDGIGNHGDLLFFFLFSDILQVCKLKKSVHSQDNRKNVETLMKNYDSPFKHLKLFSIRDIKMLIDLEDINGTKNLISLAVKVDTVSDYKRYIFQLFEDVDRPALLEELHKYFSLNYTRDEFITRKEKAEISVNVSDACLIANTKKLIKKVKKIIK